jgi:hypothetical protein
VWTTWILDSYKQLLAHPDPLKVLGDGITGKLISAPGDTRSTLPGQRKDLAESDIDCLCRIVPEDRGKKWK